MTNSEGYYFLVGAGFVNSKRRDLVKAQDKETLADALRHSVQLTRAHNQGWHTKGREPGCIMCISKKQ